MPASVAEDTGPVASGNSSESSESSESEGEGESDDET